MGKNKSYPAYKIFRFILGPIFKFYYHPTIINKEVIPKEGPILVVGNHKHIMDQCSVILSTKRVLNYMAKKEYFDGKFAWFFKMGGCISVDREAHDGIAKEQAMEILKNGGAIGLFPEGTRIKTKEKLLLDFKYGTVSMADKCNATIVPYAITGDYKFRSKNLMVRFGEPFKVEDGDLESANKKLRKIIEDLMAENLKATNRTVKEEMESHMEEKKS
jgi:1-acyl-sn-glycerol-3-phosphate acyltransferase